MTDSVGLSKVATIANAVYNSITANNTAVTGMTLAATNNDIRVNISNYGPSSTPRYPGLSVTHYTSNATGGDVGGFPVVELTRYGGNTSIASATPSGLTLGGFNTWGSNSTSALSATRIEGISEAAFTTTATAGIRFLTTNAGTQAERMRISAAGNITIPNQPMFWGGHNSTITYTAGSLVRITSSYDPNSMFSGSPNYRVTVPVAGRYLVSGDLMTELTNGALSVQIRKNGTGIKRLYSSGGYSYQSGSALLIINCAANDYIDLYMTEAGAIYGGDVGNFVVYLIG